MIIFRSLTISTLGLLLILPAIVQAQALPHDDCEQALRLRVGETLTQNNEQAHIQMDCLPDPRPLTCIKTFENDLWYTFSSDSQFHYYQIEIEPIACESPAGMQALVIRGKDCDAETFEYVACQNPYAVEVLSLWVEDSLPGTDYLVYVDGYDGNRCEFQIRLRGYVEDPRDAGDFRQQQMDYSQAVTDFEPAEVGLRCVNNEMVLNWSVASQEGVSLYLIQDVQKQGPISIGEAVGSVVPTQTVGIEQEYTYQFRDSRILAEGEEYCYRIVRLGPGTQRAYSVPICATADLNEDFFITPVLPHKTEGVYAIQFVNHRKQDLLFRLLDSEGNELKTMSRAKEPKGDGLITIDMNKYPPGLYQLRIEGKSEFFLRSFVIE